LKESYSIKKILNNNVLIATHTSYKEVVLIGKGIGFNKKSGDEVRPSSAEKVFILENEKEQEQYKKLVPHIDEKMIEVMNEVIHYINLSVHAPLNEHIHVALTDHISFALKRIQQGLEMSNPFLIETKSLYPLEYKVAGEVVNIISDKIGVMMPEGEIGFIALHIHSAIANKEISEINKHSQLINSLLSLIETSLKVKIDKESVHYLRLIRHLRYTIERVKNGENVKEPEKLALVLKEEYPLCYNLSWKVIKVMQQTLKLPVYDAEAVYLTMHLQRLVNKSE
jgi:transcriptional antiterminator